MMENPGLPGILVIGSANTDHIVFSCKLPAPGETVSGGHYKQAFGGKGANQAVAASRAGADVTLVACLGSDSTGISYLENLKRNGIHTGFIRQDEQTASGIALIMVDENGENCISVAPGANYSLSFEDVSPAIEHQNFTLALLQMEIPLPTLALSIQGLSKANIPVLLNMAPFIAMDEQVLRKVKILVLNETEATGLSLQFQNEAEPEENAVQALYKRLGIPYIIITQGAKGVILCESGVVTMHSSFPAEVIDSTAAGDTFCGYLAAGINSGMEMKDSVRFAMAASAICVGREGAQPSIPQLGEVKAFLFKQNG